MKLSLVESRLFGRICYGYRRNKQGLVEIVPEEAEVVKTVFGCFTEMETAWKEFRTIYSVKEYLLPLGKHNGAEMY